MQNNACDDKNYNEECKGKTQTLCKFLRNGRNVLRCETT